MLLTLGVLFLLQILWQFIISEEDYVQQVTTLVNIFHRPLSMAADSRCPACSRQEVKSIFSNWYVTQSCFNLLLNKKIPPNPSVTQSMLHGMPTLGMGEMVNKIIFGEIIYFKVVFQDITCSTFPPSVFPSSYLYPLLLRPSPLSLNSYFYPVFPFSFSFNAIVSGTSFLSLPHYFSQFD